MSAPLDRIRALVALAADSDSEEARTAAHQACKLIARHKVALGGAPDVDAFVDLLSRPPDFTWTSRRSSRARRTDPEKRERAARTTGIRMRSRLERSQCAACGMRIEYEEMIWWRPGLGARHEACGSWEGASDRDSGCL